MWSALRGGLNPALHNNDMAAIKHSYVILLLVLVAGLFAVPFFIAKEKYNGEITGQVTRLQYNSTGKCGNYEVDTEFKEECDNFRDEKCPGRCDNRLCICFPESEKRSLSESATRQFYFFDKLTENDTGSAAFTREGVSFTGLKFAIAGTQREFRIIVDTNISGPDNLRKMDGASVYQTFRIQTQNLSSANITSATVFFRVYKGWLVSKNFTSSDITLRKHSDAYKELHYDWITFAPRQIGESNTYYSYQAQVGGFSYFAVAAERPALCGNNVCEISEDTVNCCTDCGVRFGNEFCQNNTAKEIKCGDGFCDAVHGEDQTSCCGDCGCLSSQTCEFNACQTLVLCGNNICEGDENSFTCLQDCGNKVFFSPTFIVLTAGLAAAGIFAAYKFKSDRKEKKHMQHPMQAGRERHETTPEFSPITPNKLNLDKTISAELQHKPIDKVRAEFISKGWPREAVDEVLRKNVLLALAKKYDMHEGEKNKDKFLEFVNACRAIGCGPAEVRDVLVQLKWNKNLIERALKAIFM